MKPIRRDNHFVPKMYLKRWSVDGNKICGYRTLVSHQNVPLWNLYSMRGIAYHSDLYTRLSADGETDEFECWLEKDFETPAEEAIYKATSGQKLSPEDYQKLIRFAAAQYVRTPVQLSRDIERWRKSMPEMLETALKRAVAKLEEAHNSGIRLKTRNKVNEVNEVNLPLLISREPSDESDKTLLKAETVIGRSMWLYGIRHLLTKTLKVLLKHRWSIMHAEPNFEWTTSDDPVICLNYYSKGSYDFGGGWGRKGSEILLPLSPHHILYTKVGAKNKSRINVSSELCEELQEMIAKHSHRWIFAYEPIKDIEKLRPRVIDPIAYDNEMEAWDNWHEEQSKVEQKYIKIRKW